MDELVKNLMEELNCDTAFTIPIFGGIPVAESVFVTWLIMAVVILLCAIFVRNLKVTNPGKGQLLLETAVSGIYSFFEDILGEKGKRFIPYLNRYCQSHRHSRFQTTDKGYQCNGFTGNSQHHFDRAVWCFG